MMIADTNPIRSAWACKFEKLDSRGRDNNVPCSPLGPRGTSQVEMGGIEPPAGRFEVCGVRAGKGVDFAPKSRFF